MSEEFIESEEILETYEMRCFIPNRVRVEQILQIVTELFDDNASIISREDYEDRCTNNNLKYAFTLIQFKLKEQFIVLPVLEYCHAGALPFLGDNEDCTEVIITPCIGAQLILEAIASFFGAYILEDSDALRKMVINRSGVTVIEDKIYNKMKIFMSQLDLKCDVGVEQTLDVKGNILKIERVPCSPQFKALWNVRCLGALSSSITTSSLEDIVYTLLCTSFDDK